MVTLLGAKGGLLWAGSGLSSPLQIASCVYWLDASQATGLADGDPSGSPVLDVSGQGNHATQATGSKQPLYKTNVANGRPVWRFDNVNDTLDVSSLAALFTGSDMPASFYAVYDLVATGTTEILAFDNSALANSRFQFDMTAQFRLLRRDDANVLKNVAAGTVNVTGFHIFAGVFTGTTATTTADGTVQSNAVDQDVGVVTMDRAFIGSLSGTSTFFNGDLAELIVYNRAHSAAERKQVERYLGAKYAIVVA